jgi:hypothetical protein
MKSIYHGTAGANAKLRGKKTCGKRKIEKET